MLAHDHGHCNLSVAKRAFDDPGMFLGHQGLSRDESHSPSLEASELLRQRGHRSRPPMDDLRVRVGEGAARCVGHRLRVMIAPHQGMPVVEAGEPLAKARAAMILLHGRGATAADIMTVAAELIHPGFAYLAPQAEGNAWYPYPFTAPLEQNEPYLSAALAVIENLLAKVEATIPAQRVIRVRAPAPRGGVGGCWESPGASRDLPTPREVTPATPQARQSFSAAA